VASSPVDVRSEVGVLREVVVHRPGDELRRLTPRNSAGLLFDAIPWVERAQAEHDAFAALLTDRGVAVHYLRDLLVETFAVNEEARIACVSHAAADDDIGPRIGPTLRGALLDLDVEALVSALISGLTYGELADRLRSSDGLTAAVGGRESFAITPLPNLLFTRDSAVVIGDHVAVTRPTMAARRREVNLTATIWQFHPRLGSASRLDTTSASGLEGGDVLVLGDGVLAIGVGERTSPAGAELLAYASFAAGVAHTVLAVPIAQQRSTMHLDTVCTMVDRDAAVMFPPAAASLQAWTITPATMTGPEPFLTAAATALGIGELRLVATGLDPVTAAREQWDDGNNTLALAPGVVVAYERNERTNAHLAEAGIEVLTIAGSELGTGRGGPRCMSCPIRRDTLD